MIEVPETEYAETDDGLYIAYQVVGSHGPDLVLVPSAGNNVELGWEISSYARLLRSLAAFSRLIIFDPKGSGLSDPLGRNDQPSVEEKARDMLAVLDAVGSDRPALLANGVGGLLALYFTASYPHRSSALVLHGCYARLERADDYGWGIPTDVLRKAVDHIGTDRLNFGGIQYQAPNASQDPEFVAEWNQFWRRGAGPAQARAMGEAVVFADVRAVLPSIQVPTLVLYRRDDPWIRKAHAVYLARHIPGAKLTELPGQDNLMCVGDFNTDLEEIEEFLTGARHTADTDRVLATVMFTDIVGSTERAAAMGDKRWRELLDSHDRMTRRQIVRFRGEEVNTAGDGFVATFDGPGRAIQCACAVRDAVTALGIEIRAGLHTGEIERRGKDVAGLAVHIGARVAAAAGASEVLVSGAVPPLVAGSGLVFEDRGEHELKGVPGTWRLFAVEG